MNCQIARFTALLRTAAAVALWALLAAHVSGQDQFTSGPGVLVLRNGQFLKGEIIRHGDSYRVRVAEGSEIRIPSADVRLESDSLEGAYVQQRDLLAATDLDGRLRLAAWCLRAELPHRAADQLLAVRSFDPEYDGLDAVERRLAAWHLSQRASRQQPTPEAPAEPARPNPFPSRMIASTPSSASSVSCSWPAMARYRVISSGPIFRLQRSDTPNSSSACAVASAYAA